MDGNVLKYIKGDDVIMELDIVELIKSLGFPIAVCIILLWRLIPTVNGLKDVVNNAVVVITKLEGVVEKDSENTRDMKIGVNALTAEIARMNKNGVKKE